ncbi:hypothetical protein EGW08_000882 [Elysia chlorotica]|uniref:GCM domain-containing protein n=1 Tax=Elysia chlorotica TaxID=188477 RepID=A0A433UBY6_ELYCH|nr:hypothetical protein EGW08_000882 [Elysia chlorotica]
MLLIAESELSSMMTSESFAALGHHQPHGMLGDQEDPAIFAARSYEGNGSPGEYHHSPSAHSPPLTAGVASDGMTQHHINHFSDATLQQQQQQQQQQLQQQQPISPHHQWDINDTILPMPKVLDPFCLWPTGHCRRTYRGDSDDARRHVSGWAMRNTNNHNALILKKSCLGVLVCSRDCVLDSGRKVNLRPAICDKARRKQLAKPCPNPACSGRLELLACRGHCGYPVTHFWRHLNGAVYFQAKGYHDHPRPDVKSLSDKGRSTFNKQAKTEGGRVLSLASKRRFPILTNEAIPETKRQNHSQDEVMCSCPPFECACKKSGLREQHQQHYNPQHLYANLPHGYLDTAQGGQLPCGTAWTGMPSADPGFPPAPFAVHPPPSFTQINITNTCLPPTASLDLNIPSVEVVKGSYSSNAHFHLPDQQHYKTFQNYSFQQHKIQFGYPHPHYHQNDHSQQDAHATDKFHKLQRESCIKNESERRKLDDASTIDVKPSGDTTHLQDFQNVQINSCVEYGASNDLSCSGFPTAQVSCDLNKTVTTHSYMAREDSLLKLNKTASIMGDGCGQGDRLPDRLHASDAATRTNGQIYQDPQYESSTPVTDSSFLYDTISTVFGADQRPTSDQCSRNLVSPANSLGREELQNKHPQGNSQSPPQMYNFLETYATSTPNQTSSPPIYTELTSPQRQIISQEENFFSKGSMPASEHQFYTCSLDGNTNTHMQQQLHQQQYHSPPHHHQHQQHQHQQVRESPTQNNPIESFSPSLSHQNTSVSAEDQQYNYYNLATPTAVTIVTSRQTTPPTQLPHTTHTTTNTRHFPQAETLPAVIPERAAQRACRAATPAVTPCTRLSPPVSKPTGTEA